MLFHITADGHILPSNPDQGLDRTTDELSFSSEAELRALSQDWPMKRFVDLWNQLPGVQSVQRFTDRDKARTRLWRHLQPVRPRTASAHPVPKPCPFRGGSKASQVYSLFARTEGATLQEIRTATGWQPHSVRGFISASLRKQGAKVRSFRRNGERVYRLK